jgi:hypothetical protein
MPSANDAGASNGLLQKWEDMYAREAELVKERAEAALQHALHPEEEPSVGTSSLTSESTQDKSGSSLPASESSLQSPAPTAENPSEVDPAAPPAPSSTASSTDGSTQGTGASQADQPDSSEASQPKTEPTAAPTEPVPVAVQKAAGVAPENTVTIADQKAGKPAPVDFAAAAEALVDDARKAYNDKDYALASDLINRAEALYPDIKVTTEAAHKAIDAALAATTATQQP